MSPSDKKLHDMMSGRTLVQVRNFIWSLAPSIQSEHPPKPSDRFTLIVVILSLWVDGRLTYSSRLGAALWPDLCPTSGKT